MKIFVSVGKTSTSQQEDFVVAVENRLRAEGLSPHTIGRNTFSADAPLRKIKELMLECSGTVVIALERTYFPEGTERRGHPNEQNELKNVKFATPWNQIEAALAYCNEHPLLVIVERGLRSEGLLEKGYDWYVLQAPASPSSLASPEFNGVFSDWKERVIARSKLRLNSSEQASPLKHPSQLTIRELLGSLNPGQLWSVATALAAALAGAFALGANLLKL